MSIAAFEVLPVAAHLAGHGGEGARQVRGTGPRSMCSEGLHHARRRGCRSPPVRGRFVHRDAGSGRSAPGSRSAAPDQVAVTIFRELAVVLLLLLACPHPTPASRGPAWRVSPAGVTCHVVPHRTKSSASSAACRRTAVVRFTAALIWATNSGSVVPSPPPRAPWKCALPGFWKPAVEDDLIGLFIDPRPAGSGQPSWPHGSSASLSVPALSAAVLAWISSLSSLL